MTARWEDPRYTPPTRLERIADRIADRIAPLPTDVVADAARREAMLAHPSNQGATAGEAPRPTHGTAGRRGANHLPDPAESPSRTALGVTVAFLAVVALVLAAVSCDDNPATSLGCADDPCEVGP